MAEMVDTPSFGNVLLGWSLSVWLGGTFGVVPLSKDQAVAFSPSRIHLAMTFARHPYLISLVFRW